MSPIEPGNYKPPKPTPRDFAKVFGDSSQLGSTPNHYRLSAICQPIAVRWTRTIDRVGLGVSITVVLGLRSALPLRQLTVTSIAETSARSRLAAVASSDLRSPRAVSC